MGCHRGLCIWFFKKYTRPWILYLHQKSALHLYPNFETWPLNNLWYTSAWSLEIYVALVCLSIPLRHRMASLKANSWGPSMHNRIQSTSIISFRNYHVIWVQIAMTKKQQQAFVRLCIPVWQICITQVALHWWISDESFESDYFDLHLLYPWRCSW